MVKDGPSKVNSPSGSGLLWADVVPTIRPRPIEAVNPYSRASWEDVTERRFQNAPAAECCDELGSLFDRLMPPVVGCNRPDFARAARADHGGASLAKRCCNASPRASRCASDDSYAATKTIRAIRSAHVLVYLPYP